jgi:hypothetical protein
MPSNLSKDIEKQVNKRMKTFIGKVSEECKVDVSKLEGMWNEVCGVKGKKVSNFQMFCKKHRPELKSKNSEWKFGDINRELGKMWGKLSDKDKAKFAS